MHYVYILKSENNKYYVGASNDLIKRLEYHNGGRVKSTKSGRPWKLIYKEEYLTLAEARRRELQVKKWKSRKAIERLVSNNGLIV